MMTVSRWLTTVFNIHFNEFIDRHKGPGGGEKGGMHQFAGTSDALNYLVGELEEFREWIYEVSNKTETLSDEEWLSILDTLKDRIDEFEKEVSPLEGLQEAYGKLKAETLKELKAEVD